MSRRPTLENQALQDRIAAVLCDAWPERLTAAQTAERVGGARTLWEVCAPHNETLVRHYRNLGRDLTALRCRAEGVGYQFPATHHDGPIPQDSWQVPYNAMDMNPPLNRLARDGVVEKLALPALRAVLWRWAGDGPDPTVAALEELWQASS